MSLKSIDAFMALAVAIKASMTRCHPRDRETKEVYVRSSSTARSRADWTATPRSSGFAQIPRNSVLHWARVQCIRSGERHRMRGGSGFWLAQAATHGWLAASGGTGVAVCPHPLGLLPHPLARALGVSLAACWAGIRGFDAKSYEIFFHPSSFGITRQKCPRNVSYSASITDSISAGRTSREGGSMGSMERCEGRMERELSEDCRRSDGERS